jgi:hypothetical protein
MCNIGKSELRVPPVNATEPYNQQQQIFAVTDLNVSPKWEINFGVGPTAATDPSSSKESSAAASTGENTPPSSNQKSTSMIET